MLIRTYRDANERRDPLRFAEVPNDNAAFTKAGRQFGGVSLGVTNQNKISGRGQYFEPNILQGHFQGSAAVDYFAAGGFEMLTILNSRNGSRLCQSIQRLGVKAVLDAVERGNEIRVPDRVTDAKSR